jgi:hypothetical protein
MKAVWYEKFGEAKDVLKYGEFAMPQAKPGDSTGAGRKPSAGMYVPPNEQHPAVALPIWRQSNHGAYVSVGTERSFMGAAVTRAAALVVIDYDEAIVQFAVINRALLAASRGREDYIMLRLTAPGEVWAERSANIRRSLVRPAIAAWRAMSRMPSSGCSARTWSCVCPAKICASSSAGSAIRRFENS